MKPNISVAVIEAMDNKHGVGDGMQQALSYAETLNIPFAFSSNGYGFVFHALLHESLGSHMAPINGGEAEAARVRA